MALQAEVIDLTLDVDSGTAKRPAKRPATPLGKITNLVTNKKVGGVDCHSANDRNHRVLLPRVLVQDMHAT